MDHATFSTIQYHILTVPAFVLWSPDIYIGVRIEYSDGFSDLILYLCVVKQPNNVIQFQ